MTLRCGDGLGDLLRSCAVDVDDGDRRTFPGQRPRRRSTDTPGTAGDDGHLAVQTPHSQITLIGCRCVEEFKLSNRGQRIHSFGLKSPSLSFSVRDEPRGNPVEEALAPM